MDSGALLDSFAEAHLLARIAKKDAEAFAEFYNRTSSVLFTVAKSILSDAAIAEDVLQEVYLQIWDKAGRFDPALGRPISWSIALTRHKALDRLRSVRRRDTALHNFAEVSHLEASSSASADVELKESAAIVKQALALLPQKQRQAIELSLLRGLPHREIAAEMNEPLGTVKAWIRRGIIEIRAQLENHT